MDCNCGGSDKARQYKQDGTYNITDVVKDVMGGTVKHASHELQRQRLDLCNACEHMLRGMIHICKKCGCIIAVKVRFSQSACPISKWGPKD